MGKNGDRKQFETWGKEGKWIQIQIYFGKVRKLLPGLLSELGKITFFER